MQTKSNPSKRVWKAVKEEFAHIFKLFWRIFKKLTGIGTAILTVLLSIFIFKDITLDQENWIMSALFLLAFIIGYSLIVSMMIGGFIAFVRTLWYVTGIGTLFILILSPLLFFLVFWLFSSPLVSHAEATVGALFASIKLCLADNSLAEQLPAMPIARVGHPIVLLICLPIILVILVPQLLSYLACFIFDWGFLAEFLWFWVLFAIVLVIALIPSLFASLGIVSIALVKKVKKRFDEQTQ